MNSHEEAIEVVDFVDIASSSSSQATKQTKWQVKPSLKMRANTDDEDHQPKKSKALPSALEEPIYLKFYMNAVVSRDGSVYADEALAQNGPTVKLFGHRRGMISAASEFTVENIKKALSDLWEEEFASKYDSSAYHLGLILPEKVVPPGTAYRRVFNLVRLINDDDVLPAGHLHSIVVIPVSQFTTVSTKSQSSHVASDSKKFLHPKTVKDLVPYLSLDELKSITNANTGKEISVTLIIGAMKFN